MKFFEIFCNILYGIGFWVGFLLLVLVGWGVMVLEYIFGILFIFLMRI